MASPEELAPFLPETLPDDFGEWDSNASPAPSPAKADEWGAWRAAHSFSETPKANSPSTDRESLLASLADKPRVWNSTSSANVASKPQINRVDWEHETSPAPSTVKSGEWEAWVATHSFGDAPKPTAPSSNREAMSAPVLDKPRTSSAAPSAPAPVKQQVLKSEPANGSPSRASRAVEASRAATAPAVAPALPKAAKADAIRKSPDPNAAVLRAADEAIFQLFPATNIEVEETKKPLKKKTVVIAAAGAGTVLVSLVLVFSLLHHGAKPAAQSNVQPVSQVTDVQPDTQAPVPAGSNPVTQDKSPATAQKQQATENQPADEANGVKPAQTPSRTQAKVMDEQLTAPTKIPQGAEMQAENAPPPVSFGGAGADGLGGGGMNAGVLNGRTQSAVKVVAAKPIAVSSGVATGLLVQATQPVYPAVAKAARVSGTVELHATISKNGTVKDLQVLNGPVMLRQSAIDAVRNWRYRPYKLDNVPTEVETTISVVFSLNSR